MAATSRDSRRPPPPPPEPDSIGARLRTSMGDRTIGEIATRSGVARTYIYRIIDGRGKRGPTLTTIRALAEALGVTPAWLGFGEVAGE